MSQLDEVTQRVLENIEREPDEARELGLILSAIIAALIVKYGPAILKKIAEKVRLNICEKIQIRRSIREACPTRDDYRKYGDKIFDATIKTFPQLTSDQVQALVHELSNG